jgi:hypothetical protein
MAELILAVDGRRELDEIAEIAAQRRPQNAGLARHELHRQCMLSPERDAANLAHDPRALRLEHTFGDHALARVISWPHRYSLLVRLADC